MILHISHTCIRLLRRYTLACCALPPVKSTWAHRFGTLRPMALFFCRFPWNVIFSGSSEPTVVIKLLPSPWKKNEKPMGLFQRSWASCDNIFLSFKQKRQRSCNHGPCTTQLMQWWALHNILPLPAVTGYYLSPWLLETKRADFGTCLLYTLKRNVQISEDNVLSFSQRFDWFRFK